MSSRKPVPERSKIQRQRPVAYARRQKPDGSDDTTATTDGEVPDSGAKPPDAKPEAKPSRQPGDLEKGVVTPDDLKRQIDKIPDAPDPKAANPDGRTAKRTEESPRLTSASEPTGAKPAMVTAESPRARTATMTAQPAGIGEPPAMPLVAPPVDVSMGGIEDPTNMPGPREIPGGHPADPASTPGRVPPGDSRSFRRDNEFALVYRLTTFVISRSGVLGTRGQWRVVEYPTSASASHAYAKEASRFVSDGFSDYRD